MNSIIIASAQSKQINTSKKNKVRQHVNIYGSNFINDFLQQFSQQQKLKMRESNHLLEGGGKCREERGKGERGGKREGRGNERKRKNDG